MRETDNTPPLSKTEIGCTCFSHNVAGCKKQLAVLQEHTSNPQQPVSRKTRSACKFQFKRDGCDEYTKQAYMRGDEIGNEIESKTPPNGAKDVSSDLLHSCH